MLESPLSSRSIGSLHFGDCGYEEEEDPYRYSVSRREVHPVGLPALRTFGPASQPVLRSCTYAKLSLAIGCEVKFGIHGPLLLGILQN